MTTSAVSIAPPNNARSVAWRRLGWVVWRRYRFTLLATLAVLALLAIYLVVTGRQIRADYVRVQACKPQLSQACQFGYANFRDAHANPGLVGALLLFLPLLIGAFAGAPLVARELETGTFRYAWTQGVGRVRWTVALLVSGAVGTAVITGGFGTLIAWHNEPLVAADVVVRLGPNTFPASGVAVVGWGLASYAGGVLAGALWRRVLPALATTLGLATGLAFLAAHLRQGYEQPLRTNSLDYVPHSWGVAQWWTKGGLRVDDAAVTRVLQGVGVPSNLNGNVRVSPSSGGVDPVHYLLRHGYTQWTSYQPSSRYWPFQWIELGWLTALALLLLTAAVWLVRRRDA